MDAATSNLPLLVNDAKKAEEAASLLFDMGFTPIQVVGKNPAFGEGEGWQTQKYEKRGEVAFHFLGWEGKKKVRDGVKYVEHHKNIGVLTDGFLMLGPNTPEALTALKASFPMYDETLQRMGNNPYPCAIFKMQGEPFPFKGQKILTEAKSKDDKSVTMADIWADGSQFVAWGQHPAGPRYRFVNDKPILPLDSGDAVRMLKATLAFMGKGYKLKTPMSKIESSAKNHSPDENIFKAIKRKVKASDLLGTHDKRMACRFHKQGSSNPSMEVFENPDGDFLYCHSAGCSGDVIKLHMVQSGFSRPIEAALDLAKKYGIDVEAFKIVAPLPLPICGGTRYVIKKIISMKTEQGLVGTSVKERYRFDDTGVFLEIYIYTKTGMTTEVIQIVAGAINITSKVVLNGYSDEKDIRWCAHYSGEDFVGGVDDIAKAIFKQGGALCSEQEIKKIVGYTILDAAPGLQTRYVCPAVGLYIGEAPGQFTLAENAESVLPTLDSQKTVLEATLYSHGKLDTLRTKEVCQATADFIRSMPKVNRVAALITRGYCCIAPIAYELKRSILQVFPYLYLYGEKGSSKTQMALYSATKTFGEVAILNSDSVDSQFRLAMEFAASKYPRVIDEAKGIFEKNQSIFKSAATGVLATKRGNKDKTMDSYPAFCAFILTSNLPPLQAEEDAQGAIGDRLLIIDCAKGSDFDKALYSKTVKVMDEQGPCFGHLIGEHIRAKAKDGLRPIVEEIERTATFLQDTYGVQQRRAFCLAEMVVGVRWYYEILKTQGIEPPVAFSSDDYMVKTLCQEIIENSKQEEKAFARDFINWCMAIRSKERDSERVMDGKAISPHAGLMAQSGLYETSEEELIIARNALRSYQKAYNIQNFAVKDLKTLTSELEHIGFHTRAQQKKSKELVNAWGVVLKIADIINNDGQGTLDYQKPLTS